MQRTADFHDQIAGARLPQAAGSVDNAAALDAAVDVFDAHTSAGDAPIRSFLHARAIIRPEGRGVVHRVTVLRELQVEPERDGPLPQAALELVEEIVLRVLRQVL